MATRRTTELRYTAPGTEDVRRRIDAIGESGDRAGRRVQRGAARASTGLRGLNAASREVQTGLGNMAASAGPAGRALSAMGPAGVAAAAGVAVLTVGLTASIRAGENFERQMLTIEGVLRATGGASGQTAGQINALARDIGLATLASTGQVREAAAQLLTFRSISGDTFERTLRLSQDLAALGFGSITSATQQLGKALEDPRQGLTSLRRVGISFTAAQVELINSLNETGRSAQAQAEILDELERQVGGTGIAQAGGLSGASDSLSENWTRLLENLGNTGPGNVAAQMLRGISDAIAGINDELEETPLERLNNMVLGTGPFAPTGAPGSVFAQLQGEAFGQVEAELFGGAQAELDEQAAERVRQFDDFTAAVQRFAEQADPAIKAARDLETAQGVLAAAVAAGAVTAERAAEIEAQLAGRMSSSERAAQRLADRRTKAIADLRFQTDRTVALAAAHLDGAAAVAEVTRETEALTLARRLGLDAGAAEIDQARELLATRNEARAEVEAATEAEEERQAAMERTARAAEKNFRVIVDFGRDQFTGWFDDLAGEWEGLWGDLARIALRHLAQIAAQAAATLIAPGLGTTSAGVAGLGGAGISPLGLIGSGGQQLLGGSTLGGLFGQQLPPGVFGPPAPGALTAASLSQVLGAAGIGALGGGLLAQITGGNQTGGSVGGGIGAGIGFAVGGPIGGLIGGVGGSLLGGLFGGGGSSTEANEFSVDLATGQLTRTKSEVRSSAGQQNVATARSLAETFSQQVVPSLLGALGAQLGGTTRFGFQAATSGIRVGGPGGNRFFGPGEGNAALADAARRLIPTLEGVSNELGAAVAASQARDVPGLLSDIDLARLVLGEAQPGTLQDALADIGQAMDQMTDRALGLGLAMDRVTAAVDATGQAMVDDLLSGIQAFQNSLAISGLAPISPTERFATAQGAFSALSTEALTGDLQAIAAFPAAAQQFLGIARDTFASGEEFAGLFTEVNRTLRTILDIPGFVHGTEHAPRGLAMVGERGPELVRFNGGEAVIPITGRGAGRAAAAAVERQGAQTSSELQILIDLTEQQNQLLQMMRADQRRMNADLTRLRAA